MLQQRLRIIRKYDLASGGRLIRGANIDAAAAGAGDKVSRGRRLLTNDVTARRRRTRRGGDRRDAWDAGHTHTYTHTHTHTHTHSRRQYR